MENSQRSYESDNFYQYPNYKNFNHFFELIGQNRKILIIGDLPEKIFQRLLHQKNLIFAFRLEQSDIPSFRQNCAKNISNYFESLDFDPNASLDVIILGDHLKEIFGINSFLKYLKELLKNNGFLVVYLSNDIQKETIMRILKGEAPYFPQGHYNSDFRKFFDLQNIYGLFSECGYEIKNLHTAMNYEKDQNFFGNIHPALKQFIELLPCSNVSQFIFSAHPGAKIICPTIPTYTLNTVIERILEENRVEMRFAIAGLLERYFEKEHELEQNSEQIRILKEKIIIIIKVVDFLMKFLRPLTKYFPEVLKEGRILDSMQSLIMVFHKEKMKEKFLKMKSKIFFGHLYFKK